MLGEREGRRGGEEGKREGEIKKEKILINILPKWQTQLTSENSVSEEESEEGMESDIGKFTPVSTLLAVLS